MGRIFSKKQANESINFCQQARFVVIFPTITIATNTESTLLCIFTSYAPKFHKDSKWILLNSFVISKAKYKKNKILIFLWRNFYFYNYDCEIKNCKTFYRVNSVIKLKMDNTTWLARD
jgi:hypothetical protein